MSSLAPRSSTLTAHQSPIGRPLHILSRAKADSRPCIGDALNNGTLQVFHAFKVLAETMSSPTTLSATNSPLAQQNQRRFTQPVMGDLTGDGKMEIVAVADDLHVWTADGKSGGSNRRFPEDRHPQTRHFCHLGPAAFGRPRRRQRAPSSSAIRPSPCTPGTGTGRPVADNPDGTIATLPDDDSPVSSGVSIADLAGDGISTSSSAPPRIEFDRRFKLATVTRMIPGPATTVSSTCHLRPRRRRKRRSRLPYQRRPRLRLPAPGGIRDDWTQWPTVRKLQHGVWKASATFHDKMILE